MQFTSKRLFGLFHITLPSIRCVTMVHQTRCKEALLACSNITDTISEQITQQNTNTVLPAPASPGIEETMICGLFGVRIIPRNNEPTKNKTRYSNTPRYNMIA